jgi:hypothetical protein
LSLSGERPSPAFPKRDGATDNLKLVLAIIAAGSLVFLYLQFLAVYLPALSITDELEAGIVYTQIIRILLVAFVKRFRNGAPQFKITLFSFEVFVIAALIVAFFLTGDPSYNTLIGQVLLVWIGATLLLLTPYTIVGLGVSMYKGTQNYSLLNYACWEYVAVMFLAGLFANPKISPPSNVSGLGVAVINSITGELRTGSEVFTYSTAIIACSVIFFVALIAYASYVNAPASFEPKNYFPLFVPIFAVFLLLLWLGVFSLLSSDILIVLGAPAIGISAVLWWITRRG